MFDFCRHLLLSQKVIIKKIFSPVKYCHPAEGGLYLKGGGGGGGGGVISRCIFFLVSS